MVALYEGTWSWPPYKEFASAHTACTILEKLDSQRHCIHFQWGQTEQCASWSSPCCIMRSGSWWWIEYKLYVESCPSESTTMVILYSHGLQSGARFWLRRLGDYLREQGMGFRQTNPSSKEGNFVVYPFKTCIPNTLFRQRPIKEKSPTMNTELQDPLKSPSRRNTTTLEPISWKLRLHMTKHDLWPTISTVLSHLPISMAWVVLLIPHTPLKNSPRGGQGMHWSNQPLFLSANKCV